MLSEPETRYVKSRDAHIAYQVVGDGPTDLIIVRGYISHVEVAWESPALASFYLRLASFCRLILFDKRGTGLSDRVPEDRLPTLEQRMDDVRAVMEAVGSDRAALFGASEGGPMCLLFAATYPERTLGLLLWGCFAHYDWRRSFIGRYWGGETVDAALDRLEREWGDGGDLAAMAPSLAGDDAARRAWGRAQRLAATPTAARALLRMMLDVDVRPLLPSIRVPVVILHRTGDVAVDVSHSRYMAEHIPDARYVELPGPDHLPWIGDVEPLVAELQELVTGTRPGPKPARVVATVMFVDAPGAAGVEAAPRGSASPRPWEAWSPSSAATRCPRAETVSPPPSTGRRAPSTAPRRSSPSAKGQESAAGQACTRANATCTAGSSAASPSTWPRRSSRAPLRARCWSRGRWRTWWRARGSASSIAAVTAWPPSVIHGSCWPPRPARRRAASPKSPRCCSGARGTTGRSATPGRWSACATPRASATWPVSCATPTVSSTCSICWPVTRRASGTARDDGLLPATADAGAVLDAPAKDAYRARIADLEAEIEQARRWNDVERAARAEDERAALTHELAGALGLGGRDRRAASDSERARASVGKAVRGALHRLEDQHPELGRHLAVAVRTGTFCAYDPDPGAVSWDA